MFEGMDILSMFPNPWQNRMNRIETKAGKFNPMSSLIIVRSAGRLSRSIKSINAFLTFDRGRQTRNERIIGIAIQDDIDASPAEISESFSISGEWALYQISDKIMGSKGTPSSRRRSLFNLLCQLNPNKENRKLIAVFAANENIEKIGREMRKLREEFGRVIDPAWFIDDPMRGIMPSDKSRKIRSTNRNKGEETLCLKKRR